MRITFLLAAQTPAPEHQHEAPSAPARTWMWQTDANAFFGYNHQQRKYADFSAWESQNWFMMTGDRAVRSGRLSVHGMLSLEPFTMHAGGSPQLFQTGESYIFGADLVGSPALGPTAFKHRESARDNPQVPLAHHSLDATHITPGVLRVGVEAGPLSFEGSMFRGEEPDENRLNIDRPRLNSWRRRSWGENREFNGFDNTDDIYLLEWDLRATRNVSLYGRRVGRKQFFGLAFHPRGFTHPHFYSHINAQTVGVVRDLPVAWSTPARRGSRRYVVPQLAGADRALRRIAFVSFLP